MTLVALHSIMRRSAGFGHGHVENIDVMKLAVGDVEEGGSILNAY